MHYKKNSKLKRNEVLHSIPISCVLALLLFGFALINPTSNSNPASANDTGNTARSSNINTTLSMVIDNDVPMNPTYVEPGKTAYRSHIVKVSATDIMNYTLQLTAADGATTTLNNGSTSIPGTSAVAGKDMSSNTWGFSWGAVNSDNSEQTYYALPAYGSTGASISTGLLESAQASEMNTADFTKKLTFAANLAEGSPSGHYTTTALLSLAATPKQLVFNGIQDMQEMTSTICANANENDTTRLRDSRDGKYYWVAKLKDGNCWMTQNLALDLDVNKTLTPADTDITANWTPENSTQKGTFTNIVYPDDDETFFYYSASISLGKDLVNIQDITTNSKLCYGNNISEVLTHCADSTGDWRDVTDFTPYKTVSDTRIDEAQKLYDAHYLSGNWYTMNAATAGGLKRTISTLNYTSTATIAQISSSICPKNWSLPTVVNSDQNSSDNAFVKLGDVYNLHASDGVGLNFDSDLRKSPLYFLASGEVVFFKDEGASTPVLSMGGGGYYWQNALRYWIRNSDKKTHFYYMTYSDFSSTKILNLLASKLVTGEYGYSIRCMAK